MFSLLKRFFSGGRKPRHPPQRPPTGGRLNAASRSTFPTIKPTAPDFLDNPDLRIDAPEDPGFDPYNTGAFNRSGSWERINKRRNS